MLRTIKSILILLLVLVLGLGLGYFYHTSKTTHTESASVVMQSIRDISELALVEAQLAEIYDYKDYWGMDVSFFRKKALIKVQGTVKAGMDLDKLVLDWDEDLRTVQVVTWPEVEILSIEHDLEYYDIQEGSFNGFDAEKLTEIQDGAKKFLEHKALEGKILERARSRQHLFKDQMAYLLSKGGWTWIDHTETPINTRPNPPLPN